MIISHICGYNVVLLIIYVKHLLHLMWLKIKTVQYIDNSVHIKYIHQIIRNILQIYNYIIYTVGHKNVRVKL